MEFDKGSTEELDRHNVGVVLTHWNNYPGVEMSLQSDTLSRLRENQFYLLLIRGTSTNNNNKNQQILGH
jgi:hypothetical protein